MSYWGRPRYVPVAERRARAARKAAKLEKSGRKLKPVAISGRAMAKTFWGKAWCKNLEAYSDYTNRLPRGRTYARNGSILDLQIARGRIDALVNGSRLYEVSLRIDPLRDERWQEIRTECAGQIDSLVELLQGELAHGVMQVVTRAGSGLFPAPREIHLDCSCPDWAVMCKHVAATLYGVGARLDHEPEMLFSLRGVEPSEMIEEAINRGVTQRRQSPDRVLAVDDLSAVFGVDIDCGDGALPPEERAKRRPRRSKTSRRATKKTATTKRRQAKPPGSRDASGLTAGAKRVLAVITEERGLRTPQIAERLDMPRSTVASSIARLKQRSLVTFVGAPRNGGYDLTEKR